MMRRLKSLLTDEAGASVVELALTAPVLGALLIGMVDISRGYSVKLQVEQAAQRTIEKVMQTDANPSDFTTALKAEGAAAAGVAQSAVIVDYWLECNNTRQAWATTCTTGQTYARYVTVDISKTYTPLFRTRFAGANTNGTYTLHGQAGIRLQ